MQHAGQQRIVRAEDVAVMGVTEILRHIPRIYLSYRRLVAHIRRQRPDVAILIDFPDVNFRLAKHLARAGVPVVWFVSPQLWAWKRSRLRWIQQRVSKMLVIFPFERPFYEARGVDAEFVGHPLATEMQLRTIENEGLAKYPAAKDFDATTGTLPSNALSDSGNGPILLHPQDAHTSRETFAAQHNLDPAKPWIALLPGSRWKEIRANLPTLHELAVNDLFSASAAFTTFDGRNTTAPRDPAAHTLYEFLIPVASTIDPTALQQYIATLNAAHLRYFDTTPTTDTKPRITLVTGPDAAREALHHARASVVASGTATVLAALVGNPFVVVYRVSALTFALAKKLVQYPREIPAHLDAQGNLPVAMVNLIAGRRIVPELLQENFTAATVADALTPLLEDTPVRAAQIAALAEVRHRLTLPGPSTPIDRVAEAVLDSLHQ
jgi:lipid-A-disaccharide synthase